MGRERRVERPVKISVRNLTKVFQSRGRRVTAIDDVSFTVPDGTFLAIVGPSGCGKTTLLRILAGLEEPTSGVLEVRQTDRGRPVNSMVFQEQSILPWMTVRDNVAYGLRLRGVDRHERCKVADHYIQMVGLTRFADAYPHQLSGGMKQRVSIARAFANDPEILLMDEPFAALDEQNKILLQQELLRIWEGTRKTVCYITHSIDEALNLSDRVMIMTAHPGRVKAIIDVDLPRPRDITKIRSHPRFGELFEQIWLSLRDEVLKAKAEEGLVMAGAGN
ncbi:nitrate ABC transporter ATP-binding protein [Caldinitratiruptor microaerophilus]|uniref:Nitrate ABC transporter ATP-binding protein n=1 Tax=Caldinitratiruptor microaerophilus TaxID=671077 RepID=A0AA35CHM9_9FIRM|nr:nitrate ABC transporter ATP-binding protein [Caldinitratiruptor microaerophilus]